VTRDVPLFLLLYQFDLSALLHLQPNKRLADELSTLRILIQQVNGWRLCLIRLLLRGIPFHKGSPLLQIDA
jgi:hypothetical protein